MPELVAGGPPIPVRLLNELDSGKVVFFCGAGISADPGSELPGFERLIEHVYTANRMAPDSVESEDLDLLEEQDRSRRQPKFDKALGLLERPERLGAQALRQSVMERLSRPPTGPLIVHEALIALSRRERGVRLITTNFDNRFVQAGLEEEFIDAAPKLPVPKPHNWSSLVHLHGRIVANDDGSGLVLTAADFGRAYLTERWAARFVSELFREFTVVFVGYSVGDPVMSYMVDTLAAERAKGARFASRNASHVFARDPSTPAWAKMPPTTPAHSSNEPITGKSLVNGLPAATQALAMVRSAPRNFPRFSCTHGSRGSCTKPLRSHGLAHFGSS